MAFKKATKAQSRLRMAIDGPSGAGKTWTALAIATSLVPGGKVALLDTERGSASKYAHRFDFDVDEIDEYAPQRYVAKIREAEEAGYDVMIIDSLSHAWFGKGGALDMVNAAEKRQKSANSYTAWREVTPEHNKLVDAILQSKMHVIVTMRAKTEYVMEEDKNGKKVPRKVGMAPVQRDGMEYEFDVVADMDWDHNMVVSKTRCDDLDEKVFRKPGADVAAILRSWLTDGAPPPQNVKHAPLADVIEEATAVALEADGKSDEERKAAWVRARNVVAAWCKANDKTTDEFNAAVDKLRERISGAKSKASANGAAKMNDTEKARAIDEGRA